MGKVHHRRSCAIKRMPSYASPLLSCSCSLLFRKKLVYDHLDKIIAPRPAAVSSWEIPRRCSVPVGSSSPDSSAIARALFDSARLRSQGLFLFLKFESLFEGPENDVGRPWIKTKHRAGCLSLPRFEGRSSRKSCDHFAACPVACDVTGRLGR